MSKFIKLFTTREKTLYYLYSEGSLTIAPVEVWLEVYRDGRGLARTHTILASQGGAITKNNVIVSKESVARMLEESGLT